VKCEWFRAMAPLVATLVLWFTLGAGARVVQNSGATASDSSRRDAGVIAPISPGHLKRTRTSGSIRRTGRPRQRALSLRQLLLLRGGEEALPGVHDTELSTASVATEASEIEAPPRETYASTRAPVEQHARKGEAQDMPAQAKATRWRFLQKVWNLMQPNHEYAMKAKGEVDKLLADNSQISGFAPDDESWRTQRQKLNVVELSAETRKRVLRDLRLMKLDGPELGLEVEDAECLTDWVIKMVGAPGTVYAGEIYRLRVRFHPDYPRKPPTMSFMRPVPVHEHIYSDGRICLNILYGDWNPYMDVKSLSLSLLSMLSSAKKKSRPPDNDSTVIASLGKNSRTLNWQFDDLNC